MYLVYRVQLQSTIVKVQRGELKLGIKKTDANIFPIDLPLKVFDLQNKSFGDKISFQNTTKLPREFEFQRQLKKM